MQCAYRQFEIALGNDRLNVGLSGYLLKTRQRHAGVMQRAEGARRILWALTSREVYRNLVRVGGWTPAAEKILPLT